MRFFRQNYICSIDIPRSIAHIPYMSSVQDIRRLFRIQPRVLRPVSAPGLSSAGPLVLVVPSKTAAGELGGLIAVEKITVDRRLDPHTFALARRCDGPWPELMVRGSSVEAFALKCNRDGLFAKAASAAGLRYARQAAADLLASPRAPLPAFVLHDWPKMEIRAVMVDASRTCVESVGYLKGLVDRLAAYRCNMLQVYFEERLAFARHPKLAHPMAYALTQMNELGRYANARGVELVGQFATFGHCQGFLSVPEYRKLGDGDQIYQLNPLDGNAKRMLRDMLEEWDAANHSAYVHAAFDEAPYFGNSAQTRKYIETHGVERFMAAHLVFLHDILAGQGKRMMVWGDMLKHYPGVLRLIPRDIIIVEWGYDAVGAAHRDAIAMFQRKGFEVLVAPAASRSAQIHFPARGQIVHNIPDFLRLGAEMGVKGALICQWEALSRFARWSEPGFALGCRLAWEGRTERIVAKREAICQELFDHDGAAVDKVFASLSPDLLIKRFQRRHFDPAETVKRYHLDTHEICPTDPLIYLRYGASGWARRVAARYEQGAAAALATFTGDSISDRMMRFAAKACLFIGYKRTKVNDAGVLIRHAARAFAAGDGERCCEQLAAAIEPVEQLGGLAAEVQRAAKGVWRIDRRGDDPTFPWMYGHRYVMAAKGCARFAREIRRCIQSVRSGHRFTLTDAITGRVVYCFRIGLRAESGINIVDLKVHLSSDGRRWRFDRRIEAFQPAGAEYDYLWAPLEPAAQFIKVEVTRTQAAWTPKDLAIYVYRPLGPAEPRDGGGQEMIDTEEYRLVRCPKARYRRTSSAKTEGVFTQG